MSTNRNRKMKTLLDQLTRELAEKKTQLERVQGDIERAEAVTPLAHAGTSELETLYAARRERLGSAFIANTTADTSVIDRQIEVLEATQRKSQEKADAAASAINILSQQEREIQNDIGRISERRREIVVEQLFKEHAECLVRYCLIVENLGKALQKIVALERAISQMHDNPQRFTDERFCSQKLFDALGTRGLALPFGSPGMAKQNPFQLMHRDVGAPAWLDSAPHAFAVEETRAIGERLAEEGF